MSIKESSDELNPPVVTADAIPKAKTQRSLKDYLALAIATCGVGYLPLAPGTWGSLLGLGLFVLLRLGFYKLLWMFPPGLGPPEHRMVYVLTFLEFLSVCLISLAGVWAGSRVEKILAKKDPGKVVIDEVAGQMLTLVLAWTPFIMDSGVFLATPLILAFAFFRIFDIVKPFPARRLESLPGGLGIMADDLIAGVYAALVTMLIVTLSWFI